MPFDAKSFYDLLLERYAQNYPKRSALTGTGGFDPFGLEAGNTEQAKSAVMAWIEKRPNETDDQWLSRMRGPADDPRVDKLGIRAMFTDDTNWIENTVKPYLKKMGAGQEQDKTGKEIDAFLASLTGKIDWSDPQYANILNNARANAEQYAKLRGIEGGVANAGIQNAEANARAGLQFQRQGLAANVLGMKSQRELGMAQLQEQALNSQFERQQIRNASMQRPNPLMGALQGGMSGAAAGASIPGAGPYGAIFGGLAGAGLGYWGASQARPVSAPTGSNYYQGYSGSGLLRGV